MYLFSCNSEIFKWLNIMRVYPSSVRKKILTFIQLGFFSNWLNYHMTLKIFKIVEIVKIVRIVKIVKIVEIVKMVKIVEKLKL